MSAHAADEPDDDVELDQVPRGPRRPPLGGALRRAWIGYQLRLDQEMTAAGFPDRRFPDGRVLRFCARAEHVTASEIGRELGITRQGAAKIVAALHERGFITLTASPDDRREKVLALTPHARDYLAAQRAAARHIEQELQDQLGPDGFKSLTNLLDALAGDEQQPRMLRYLRQAVRSDEDPGA